MRGRGTLYRAEMICSKIPETCQSTPIRWVIVQGAGDEVRMDERWITWRKGKRGVSLNKRGPKDLR